MNCETYLSMLATLPVDELGYGDARAHAANCRDCDRVTRVVAEHERNMVLAFNDVHPPFAAGPIAARALEISRRRRIAFFYKVGLGIATVATMFFWIAVRRAVPSAGTRITEVVRLQCLSPEQALEVLRPVKSPSVIVSAGPSTSLGVIQVAAFPEEMERLRAVLERYDSPAESQCGVQVVVPKVIRP